MPDEPRLKDQVSIITGANGVIGRGIALELAAAGSDLVLQVERERDSPARLTGDHRAKDLVEEVEGMGRRALPVNCDVRDADQVQAMVDETVEAFGRLDVMVNNAGVVSLRPLEEMSEQEWDKVLDVNLKGMFLCSRAVIPHLRKTNGTIINNGSIASFGGAAGMTHYCASKHAVIGLTKALALELAPHDVTVNAVCPGIVDTPMWSEVLTPDPDQYRSVVAHKIPLGRDQTAGDMGRLAVFLAENRNVTGEAIKVDGGITCSV